MLAFVIFAAIILSALILAIIWLYPGSKKVTTIPGMNPSSKEDGNLSDIGRAGSLHEFLVDLHGRYGPIAGFWWGQIYTVSIASPQLFKQQAHIFDRPASVFKLFEPLIGTASIQYANGTDGHKRRHYYDRAFKHDRLQSYYEHFQQAADVLVEKWSEVNEADLVPLFENVFEFAVRASLLTILGEDFKDDKLVHKLHSAYNKAWGEMELRLADPIIPGDDSPRMKEFEKALAFIKETVHAVVEQRGRTTCQGTLLIDDLLEFCDSKDVLSSDSITFMVGSFHTTGNLLTWCLYYLATHEDVQEKVYQEIIDVLGNNGRVEDSNYEDLKYMKQVLDEAIRCGVIAPYAARYQSTDSELGGHKIPADTPVIQALGVVLQDETIWPLHKRFDPDRFSEANIKSRHPYAYQPFGFAGKRKCPGYKYSYIESKVLLASVLQRFKIKMHGDQVVRHVYGLVTHPAEQIWIQITKRP